ncbi:hypothetical protein KOM00_11395 [Geomonas sp. Red69]|uniref:Lipoprotein n=1 Tax=Geomonas diazotrophica TaxID=2843197 RepID=A0ABX8JMM6_9BACT|nr:MULTISPECIES: hypothetical protein [Geomonas]MBU5637336.1 hypothetical protein [Geomonas diazotrophica]QWV99623.1 hypothetical protein KP005_10235 [Geomonas nitrogeniifigens]
MRKFFPVKFFSSLLLAVVFCTSLSGACDTAHALERCGTVADCVQADSHVAGDCDTPDCPLQGEAGHDDCDFCCDCACHVSLSVSPFSLDYNPVFAALQSFDRFTFIPEVFLSKFVPPQLRA